MSASNPADPRGVVTSQLVPVAGVTPPDPNTERTTAFNWCAVASLPSEALKSSTRTRRPTSHTNERTKIRATGFQSRRDRRGVYRSTAEIPRLESQRAAAVSGGIRSKRTAASSAAVMKPSSAKARRPTPPSTLRASWPARCRVAPVPAPTGSPLAAAAFPAPTVRRSRQSARLRTVHAPTCASPSRRA